MLIYVRLQIILIMIDNRRSTLRRNDILNSLSLCDDDSAKISILVDQIIQQQDYIEQLQSLHCELLAKLRCARKLTL